MDNHHLAVSLPADRLTRVLNLLRKLSAELPFLISLDDEERDALPGLADRDRAYVDRALQLVQAHAEFMPRQFDRNEFAADVALLKALGIVHSHMSELMDRLDDTLLCVESDAYRAALEVHRYAHLENAEETGEIDALLEGMSRRYFRRCHVPNPAHP